MAKKTELLTPAQFIRCRVHGSLADLAKKVGWSNGYVSDLLSGNRLITAEKANRLADALKFDSGDRSTLHRLGAIDAGWEI